MVVSFDSGPPNDISFAVLYIFCQVPFESNFFSITRAPLLQSIQTFIEIVSGLFPEGNYEKTAKGQTCVTPGMPQTTLNRSSLATESV